MGLHCMVAVLVTIGTHSSLHDSLLAAKASACSVTAPKVSRGKGRLSRVLTLQHRRMSRCWFDALHMLREG